jgi:hypothetical protein
MGQAKEGEKAEIGKIHTKVSKRQGREMHLCNALGLQVHTHIHIIHTNAPAHTLPYQISIYPTSKWEGGGEGTCGEHAESHMLMELTIVCCCGKGLEIYRVVL